MIVWWTLVQIKSLYGVRCSGLTDDLEDRGEEEKLVVLSKIQNQDNSCC